VAIGTAALILGGLTAASGVAGGVGQAVAARRTREDIDRELEELRRQRGLSGRERQAMQSAAQAEQVALERTLQGQQQEQLAAQAATGGAISGRDIFLREQAAQQARQEASIAAGQQELQADLARRAETAQREADLQAARMQAEAARTAGITQALTGGLAGGAVLAQQQLERQQLDEQREFDLQLKLAELGELDDDQVLGATGAPPNPYGTRL